MLVEKFHAKLSDFELYLALPARSYSTPSGIYSMKVILEVANGRGPIIVEINIENYTTIHIVQYIWDMYTWSFNINSEGASVM